jgi:hypothetical protein
MSRRYYKQYELSKFKKNDLFRAIESSGIAVIDFELSIYKVPFWITLDILPVKRVDWPITAVYHQKTKSIFGLRQVSSNQFGFASFKGNWDSAADLFNAKQFSANPYITWDDSLWRFRQWLDAVKVHIERVEEYERAPDLWKELKRSKDFLGGQPEQDVENTPFTEAEQVEISGQIALIREYIKTAHELTSEQIAQVESKLDEAEGASRRVGRKDWLMAFNGAVFSLLLTDLITPPTAQHIMLMTIHGLSHLFGIGGPPVHLPPAG